MLEAILEFFGEFLLQILVEAFVELGFHSLAEPFRRRPNPWLASLGFFLLGAICGGLSLIAFRHNLVPPAWRLANLVLTPLASGACMALIGKWRARHRHAVLRIDRFAYGYLFALGMAIVRYFLAS